MLVAAFLVQALVSVQYTSLTFDEPVYIASGYSYWVTRDGRMNVEHPPALKMLIGLPLLPLQLTLPTDDPSWQRGEEGTFAQVFLSRNVAVVERIVFWSRLPVVLAGAALALFVRRWAAELWGAEAGLAALMLFVFEPNILANSSLATLDLGLSAFMFVAVFYAWTWLRTGRRVHGVLASAALGGAILSKEAALAFLPIICVPFLISHVAAGRGIMPRHIAMFKGIVQLLCGAVVVVLLVYAVAFQWRPLLHPGSEHRTVDKVLARIPGLTGPAQRRVVAVGQHIWVPGAAMYVQGLLDQRRHLAEGHATFVMGRQATHGQWYDYLMAFLIKTPIPVLLLILTRLILLPIRPAAVLEYLMVLPIIMVLLLASVESQSAYLGIRMILPLYPFLFVWLSRCVVLLLPLR